MCDARRSRARGFFLAGAAAFAVLLSPSAEALPIVSVSAEGLSAANAAQATFLAGLSFHTTESFEGYTVGYFHSLPTPVGTFSQVIAGDNQPLCSPHCSDGLWVLDAAHSPAWGRFATDGTKWLDTNDSRVTMWQAGAFVPTRIGFYITDPDDAGGDFQIVTKNSLGQSSTFDLVPNNEPNGTVFYVNISDPFGIKQFKILSNAPNDGLGIDRFTIGSPVPEPATLGLLGSGLVAAALRGRKRRG
jgi:hypothetical protein